MTFPTVTARGTGWRVRCSEHDLDRQVTTEAHAQNLLSLHVRVDHTEAVVDLTTVDVAAAAAAVVACWDTSGSRGLAALTVWEALTGLTAEDALEYAQTLTEANATVTATVAPF